MQGKRGVIMGVANNRSIAWGIAKACRAPGRRDRADLSGRSAEEAGRAAGRRRSAASSSAIATSPTPATIDAVFDVLTEKWGKIDFVVHAIAFSDKDELDGRYVDTTAGQFHQDHADLLLLADRDRAARREADDRRRLDPDADLLRRRKGMPHYNVMGVAKAALEASVRYLAADLGEKNIRVNAISAGPIKTLAASGHRRFPLHPEVERIQLAAAPHRHDRGGRRQRALSAVRPVARRHRRSAPRRFRLSRRRHEAPGRAGHFAGARIERRRHQELSSRHARADAEASASFERSVQGRRGLLRRLRSSQ